MRVLTQLCALGLVFGVVSINVGCGGNQAAIKAAEKAASKAKKKGKGGLIKQTKNNVKKAKQNARGAKKAINKVKE